MGDENTNDKPRLTPAQVAHRTLLHARRVSIWSMRITVVLASTVLVAVIMLLGQKLHMPEYVRARLEERVEQAVAGLQATFGDMQFVLDEDWHPRLQLLDFEMRDAEGRSLLRVADVQVSLALASILQGRIEPDDIAFSGVQATLRRNRDGKVELSLGGGIPLGQAASVPDLIRSFESNWDRPQLAALDEITMDSLTLRYEDLRQGRAWTLDGGVVRVLREGRDIGISAAFSLLSGRDSAGSVELSYSSTIGELGARFGASVSDILAQDIAAQSPALAWLGVLRAPISGALRSGLDETGALAPLSATLQIGAGVIQPTERTRPIPFHGARSYFTYDPEEQTLTFDELAVESAWASGAAVGRAFLNTGPDGALVDMEAQFSVSRLRLDPEGQLAQPLEFREVGLDFRLVPAPFRFTLGELRVNDGDNTFRVGGDLTAELEGWRLLLQGQAERLTPERAVDLWPLRLAPKPRKWVSENLWGGRLVDLDFALRRLPGKKPEIAADFDFDGVSVRFLKTMPPIAGARGHASLVGKRFSVTATGGRIPADKGGAIEIAGTSFIIPDVSIKKAAPARVRLAGSGSVTAVMSLLNRPPLNVLKGTPLPVDLADGLVRATGTLDLPLKKGAQFEEMDLRVEGDIVAPRSTVLVPGHVLAAPVMSVRIADREVSISGGARIDEVPVRAVWRQRIGKGVPKKSRLEGEIELSPRLLQTFAVGLPPGSVSGKGKGRFQLDFAPGQPPALSLSSDLVGVGLRIPQVNWSKPKTTPGRLELRGVLGERTRIDRLELQAPGLNATGTVLNRPGGGLEQAQFDRVRLGGWLDSPITMIGRGDRTPEIRIEGGTVDLRRATFGGGENGEDVPLTIRLSRLQVTDSIALTDFAGTFSTGGGFNGIFEGLLNGQVKVEGTVVPRNGRSAVRVRSGDGGAVMRAAGILKKAWGGQFTMTLIPVESEGTYEGTLKIENTRIKDAPAIAALLNAISVVGLINELAGQGILFSTVEARFRLDPQRLTLYQGSAEGASMGLSMDGTYDFEAENLDMRGVVSPVYVLNALGSILTRRGEGLLGFSYRLTGPAESPRVQVNPLSALAPGMFRDIFRGAPPADPNRPRPDRGDGTQGPAGGDR
ncbi:YhdP family protein [Jhaorihella thermophila]|uniref:YhdP central domain-containing protein n=1 Tax=Jhaorihella thermophila TaxID=488547 RepID=A0A1H5WIN8_9RHOB|nr:AsmA-like C-terminal region-containing protein [Jhaorihella thermophila]SEF99141.1 Protein of unknown function [Jhaorihella thermophila]